MEREKAGEKNGETNEIAQGESEVDGKLRMKWREE